MAITEKHAIALLLTIDKVDAMCFPVVKNSGRHWAFAESHSRVLRNIVSQLADQWIKYLTITDESWFFNLRGYAFVRGRMYDNVEWL